MEWKIDRKKCLACGACVAVCPFLAVELTNNQIVNNKEKCTACGICSRVCPVKAIKVE
jgi:ferredoxin